VICSTSGGISGKAFTRLFVRHVDGETAGQALVDAVAFRLADLNVTDAERARMQRLVR
jgi:hypothetical protein